MIMTDIKDQVKRECLGAAGISTVLSTTVVYQSHYHAGEPLQAILINVLIEAIHGWRKQSLEILTTAQT